MSLVRRDLTVPAGTSVDANLNPFQRFPGRGGHISVKATCVLADVGKYTYTLLIGSDIAAQDTTVGVEATVGAGPIEETAKSAGFGAPGDPITLTFKAAAGAINPLTFAAEVTFS